MSPPFTHRSRRYLVNTAKAVVSVGLLVWLLHNAGLASLGNAARHADVRWLLLAVVIGLLSTCVQAWQWQALLKAFDMPRRWLRCLRLVFAGNTFNTVLPTSIGGDVVRAAMVAEQPSQRMSALTTVVLQRLCNFPGMILIMSLGLFLTLASPQADRIRPVAALGVAGGVLGLAVCATPLLGWLARRRTLQRIRIARLFQLLHEFRGEGRQLLRASARGTMFWGLSVLNQWCFMHAVGINIDITYAAVVTTTVNAITMLPVSINGYGVREGGFVAFLTVAGLASTSAALAASLCLAAQSLLWALVGIPFVVLGSRAKPSASTPVAVAEPA